MNRLPPDELSAEVIRLMQSERLCVLSTVDGTSKSQSAIVAFSENENFELMIGTSDQSRKFKNISKNPNVSVVIGFNGETAIQYEGIAAVIDGNDLNTRLVEHFKKQPWAKKYLSEPNQVYILVKPTWLRLVKSDPTVLGEMEFSKK